ncbi:hypothetical protein ACLE20_00375 [Rhizobium sp. YIM 134829]|uniref:hypothetical protein n=1 Tax=Rhizobium sp. YIM 134829 TaxID=3390453 RepID=UPI00397D0E22
MSFAELASDTAVYFFFAAGLLVFVVGVILIFGRFPVTTGHALIVGIAAALSSLPFVTSFEWTEKGFKFETRQVGEKLTDQIAKLREDYAKTREDLGSLVAAAENNSKRISALELAGTNPTSAPNPLPTFDPSIFDRLQKNNDKAVELNVQRLQEVEQLKRNLQELQLNPAK